MKKNKRKLRLPSRKALKNSIDIIYKFRDCCKHQLDVGYWATIDFPSKHHINNILQLQYRKHDDLVEAYGIGLTDWALGVMPTCKAYLEFIRGTKDEEMENT